MQALMLHFDVNKTLILKDTSKGMDESAMIVSLLAEFTIGKWDEQHGPMTYRDYVHKVLVPNEKDKTKRQQEVGQFLEKLQRSNHPLCHEVLKKRDEINEKLKQQVFQSFYNLVRHLRERNMRFVIILRTFGNDLQEVIEAIGKHPDGICIKQKASFKNKELHIEGGATIDKANAIFETFLHSQEHFAIQDCWKEWHDDDEMGRSGKPFFFDASGKWRGITNLSLFFDDNFTGEEKDIVSPVDINGAALSGNELKEKMVFTVNPIAAILEDDYYIKLVQQAVNRSVV